MPRKRPRITSLTKPTDSECRILSVLWAQGPATVREVFEQLNASHDMGYTTVLKFMQIMTEKGLLQRDTSVRPQVFRPTREKSEVQG